MVAWVDVLGFLPRIVGDVPELVILGRRDRAVAYFVFDQRVRIRPSSEDFAWSGLAGFGVVSEHDVTDLDISYSEGGAVS